MSIEKKLLGKIAEKNKDNPEIMLSSWRQLMSEREMFLQARDRISDKIKEVEQSGILADADNDDKKKFEDLKVKIAAVS